MKNELRNIREKPKQWQKPQSNDIIVENYSQPTFVWKLKADEMWCENRQWASGVQKNKHETLFTYKNAYMVCVCVYVEFLCKRF